MDNVKLKELVLKELQKEASRETAKDENNIDEPLVNKLVAEFCEKNPDDFAVLNTFNFSNAHENAAETPESIKYKLAINHAGLEYKKNTISDALEKLNASVDGDNGV